MHKPTLLVIAGCNGSGKSLFSKALTPDGSSAYDYDLVFLDKFNSLIDNELKERIAHNLSKADLENSIDLTLRLKKDINLVSKI